eukprot:6194488-Pleurochrysis_carterae.AAC.1
MIRPFRLSPATQLARGKSTAHDLERSRHAHGTGVLRAALSCNSASDTARQASVVCWYRSLQLLRHRSLLQISCSGLDMDEEVEQCTYTLLTKCHDEGLSGKSMRNCYQCGSEGRHHHMCAVSNEVLQAASAVANSTSTLCAVCAGVLSLDQVSMIESDQGAAQEA